MAKSSPGGELLICDYNGTARSGKGTIVKALSERYPEEHSGAEVIVEECGKDYRAITRHLIDREIIRVGMDKLAVMAAAVQQSEGDYENIVGNRAEEFQKRGDKPFYQGDVNSLVGLVAPLPSVRRIVKGALRQRVETHAANRKPGETTVVLLDGRNLSKAVEKVVGTKIILRTFVECSPLEAALRETGDDEYLGRRGAGELDAIVQRNYEDQHRELDAAVADADAIDFWSGLYKEPFRTPEIEALLGARERQTYWQAVEAARENPLNIEPRTGRGDLAARSGRQIRFDTTPFRAFEKPKDAMLAFAYEMFEEAIAFAVSSN